jgi:hypothetical protein
MSCRHFQRLLHLNRTGEISAREADELRDHLRLCEKCSLEYRRIQRADEFLDRLRAYSPVPKSPEALTAGILHRVRAETSLPRQTDLMSRTLDFFLIPAVRYAAVACIFAVVSTLMIQLIGTLNDVTALERQMATVINHTPAAPEPMYMVQSQTLQNIAASTDVKALAGTTSLTMSEGHIEVSGKDAEAILSLYNLGRVSASVGASALHIDRKTLDRIINEVKATAELTIRTSRQGA